MWKEEDEDNRDAEKIQEMTKETEKLQSEEIDGIVKMFRNNKAVGKNAVTT